MTKALVILHVLSGMTALGLNASYGVWLARAGNDPVRLDFALRGIKWIDDRMANVGYWIAFATGGALIGLHGLDPSRPWLLGSAVLLGLAMILAYGIYTPNLAEQIRVLAEHGPVDPRYVAASRKGQLVGIAMFVIALAIVVLMFVKP